LLDGVFATAALDVVEPSCRCTGVSYGGRQSR
jgi:hypothetical protein